MIKEPAQFLITNNIAKLQNLCHERLQHPSYARIAKLLDLAEDLSFAAAIFSKETHTFCIKS